MKPIVYVTRDIERALGLTPSPTYRIITNRSPYAEQMQERYPDFVTLIDSAAGQMSTAELMKTEVARTLISELQADVLIFKNNAQTQSIAVENNWRLLNPDSSLAEKVENKISQVEWLGELAEKYLAEHRVAAAGDLAWNKTPLVIQWGHGHSGDSTILVNSAGELNAIQKAFPDRKARATAFVRGPSFTVNAVVTKESILVGNISYQITGLAPFTDNPFTTVGNDWSLTHSLLSETEIRYIDTMAREIGERLQTDGWLGLFGIDVIWDDELNKILLIEINARQPASTTFESFLQEENRRHGLEGMTTFEAHVGALQDRFQNGSAEARNLKLIEINDGAQVIQRITKTVTDMPDDTIGSLEMAGYMTIPYANTEINTDLLRMQSRQGIMETHNKLNKRGKEISDIINS